MLSIAREAAVIGVFGSKREGMLSTLSLRFFSAGLRGYFGEDEAHIGECAEYCPGPISRRSFESFSPHETDLDELLLELLGAGEQALDRSERGLDLLLRVSLDEGEGGYECPEPVALR